MKSVVIIMVLTTSCAQGRSYGVGTADTRPRRSSPQRRYPGENVALKAFAHGNTCLAEGKFAEATAAFHQARELEPTLQAG